MQRLEELASKKNGYAISKARNLVWALLIPGALNDPKLQEVLEEFGNSVRKEAAFREYLRKLGFVPDSADPQRCLRQGRVPREVGQREVRLSEEQRVLQPLQECGMGQIQLGKEVLLSVPTWRDIL